MSSSSQINDVVQPEISRPATIKKSLFQNLDKYFLIIAVLALAGLYLRLTFSSYLGSFLFDEYFSVYFAKLPINEMFTLLLYDNNLPLYQVILWFWIRLFGENELVVRLIPIITSVPSAFLMYALGKKMFSRTAGVVAVFFLSFSSFIIFYTTEARSYSLLIFFSLLSTWFFWKIMENGGKASQAGYILATVLLAFTHLTGIFLVAAQVVFVMIRYHKEKEMIVKWFFIFTITGLLTLPYYAYYYFIKKELLFTNYFFQHPYIWKYFLYVLRNYFRIFNNSRLLEIIYILTPLLMIGNFFAISGSGKEISIKIKKSWPAVYCFLAMALVVILCFIFKIIDIRYSIIAAVFMFLLIGQGIYSLLEKNKFLLYPALFLILISLIIPYKFLYIEYDTFGRVGKCLEEIGRPNSKIIVNNYAYDMLVKKYYKGNAPIEGFYPLSDNLSYEQRIVMNSGRPLITKANVNSMDKYTDGYNTITLVEAIYVPLLDANDDVKKWFKNQGWSVEDKFCYIEDRVKVYNFFRKSK